MWLLGYLLSLLVTVIILKITHNNRVCGVHLYDSGIDLLLIMYSLYAICIVSTDDAYDEYSVLRNLLLHILLSCIPDTIPLHGGDFNVDFAWLSPRSALLYNFYHFYRVALHTRSSHDKAVSTSVCLSGSWASCLAPTTFGIQFLFQFLL